MHKRIYTILILLICAGSLKAQQEALYSQYMFNMLALNPAYAGSRDVLSVTGLTRAQWIGMEGAPVSNTLCLDAPVKNKHIGLGLQLFNEKIGVTTSNAAYGSYAYHIRFKKSTLALGLQGGVLYYTANYTKVQLSRSSAQVDQPFRESGSVWMPEAGAGVFFSNDNYYLGASVPTLLNTQIQSGASLQVNKAQHLFVAGGYVIALNNDLKLKPSFLVKGVKGAPFELDVNMNFWIYDKLGLGASYRTGDAAVFMAEFQLAQNFRMGYAYDYSVTRLRHFHSGSHELMLRYEFGYSKEKVITPRYF